MRAILEVVARENAEKVQSALYRIAELASAAEDMQEFYRAIHEVVGELMFAQNFYIALWDEQRQLINYPYYVDEITDADDLPDPHQWYAVRTDEGRGLTAYVLRTGEPQLVDSERYQSLIEQDEIVALGITTEESSWLGVPLDAERETVGVLAVQSYTAEHQYTEHDRDLLAFVGQHVGAALSRARAIEETRQRNAELALINSVQEALAGELEQQAIYDARRRQDPGDLRRPGRRDHDARRGDGAHAPPVHHRARRTAVPGAGSALWLRATVLETREPVLLGENLADEVERYGSEVVVGEMPKSVLFVPLLVGGKATGVISLQNIDREHAFSSSDEELLETLAASLSVALENARLVHETRQRNAELALINSVQEALAGELEMQAIYDVVGDKIQEIFDAQGVSILSLDETTGVLSFPYVIQRGERQWLEPGDTGVGVSRHVLETGEPLLINEDYQVEAERHNSPLGVGEPTKSALFVPLISGRHPIGVIALDNLDREHAFGESDQQLLETLAGSLSVALENARLVHETRQRNAELALINSVQEALAGELEMQAIYDVVGDKIQEIFDAQVVDIGIFDFAAELTRYPYTIERGVRFPDEPTPIETSWSNRQVIETKAPVLINDVSAHGREQGEPMPVVQGEPAKSVLFAPLISGDEVHGRISLQNLDRTNAFTESDVRLLTTLAGSLSVALENARLVHETRQRNAELALINSVQEAIAGELDQQAIYDIVGDKIEEIFDAQGTAIAIVDEATGLVSFPYLIERGERLRPEPQLLAAGFTKHVLDTGEPLLINEDLAAEGERLGSFVLAGESAKSLCGSRSRRAVARMASFRSTISTASTRSASPTSSCWRRWPAASAWRSRTRGSCTRPGSGTRSWR